MIRQYKIFCRNYFYVPWSEIDSLTSNTIIKVIKLNKLIWRIMQCMLSLKFKIRKYASNKNITWEIFKNYSGKTSKWCVEKNIPNTYSQLLISQSVAPALVWGSGSKHVERTQVHIILFLTNRNEDPTHVLRARLIWQGWKVKRIYLTIKMNKRKRSHNTASSLREMCSSVFYFTMSTVSSLRE